MKLKLFKAKQKEWNSNNHGIQVKKKKDMLDLVLQIDKIQEQRNLNDDEFLTKANLEMKFEEKKYLGSKDPEFYV